MSEDRTPLDQIDWEVVAMKADYCVATAVTITKWSAKSIGRYFKKRWKSTTKQRFKLLRGRRMKQALKKLRPTDAALKFGQPDLSHFGRMYKAAHGHSPRHDRELSLVNAGEP